MDITPLFDLIQSFDAAAAAGASENSGFFPWILSALGLSGFAWHRGAARAIDPNHPLLSGPKGSTVDSMPQHPHHNDTRLAELYHGQETGPSSISEVDWSSD